MYRTIAVNQSDYDALKKLADKHDRTIVGEMRYLVKKELDYAADDIA